VTRIMTGRLVTLLGYDGSGKSTLLDQFRRDGFATSTWRQLQSAPQMEFMRVATIDPGRYREALPALTRATYLLIALFAEYELHIQPTLQEQHLLFVESYYLRPVAKELLKGRAASPLLLQAVAYMQTPTCM
jgi:thymidylate kinase